jgi:hypothetical protein
MDNWDIIQLWFESIVAIILLVVGFLLGILISRLSHQFTDGKSKALALLVPPAGSFLVYLILANNVIWRLIDLIGGFINQSFIIMVYQELSPMNILAILIGATLGGILNRKFKILL